MQRLTLFPFLAVVGQDELREALLLSLINPQVGGVLLIGPHGIGKTTAVRGLIELLPGADQSVCEHGCMPGDGMDICEECLKRLERGESLTRRERIRLLELPLNSRLEDVVGGVNERIAMEQNRIVLQPGILARANNNVLYIDEVNLLENTVIDAILDAAAQGRYTVRRGPLVGTYPSRFVLIGSMNPQEGLLRPQLTDRFGLRVVLEPLMDAAQRMDVYSRARAFLEDPQRFRIEYAEQTQRLATMVQEARDLLPQVRLTKETAAQAMELVLRLKIPSNRAEIALLEAARARAASDARTEVITEDIAAAAPLALRLRQSAFIDNYLQEQKQELRRIQTALHSTGLDGKVPAGRKGRPRKLSAPA